MTQMPESVQRSLIVLQSDPNFINVIQYLQEDYVQLMRQSIRCQTDMREYIAGRAYQMEQVLEIIALANGMSDAQRNSVVKLLNKKQKAFV